MQFGELTLKQCRYGWMLFCGPHIGKCFDLYGEYSECEVAAMRGLVRPDDVVVDIGANIGDLTVPLSQMVGPGGQVYAVESNPDNFNILCANLALNHIVNVKPLNVFVKKSEDAGVYGAYVGDVFATQFITIDDLNLPRCRLIKIDVDGNELDVLHSAAGTIARHRPFLYLENDVQAKSKALLTWLLAQNYALYWHLAPIFAENNFFNNPVNYWAPDTIISIMVLCVPRELGLKIVGLEPILDPDAWVL